MGITKNNVFQINATIIAGLLILFTIQSVVSDSLYDLSYSYLLLQAESEVLEEIRKDISEAKEIYANVDEEGIIPIEPIPNNETGELEFTIPAPLPLIEEQEKRIISLTDENVKNQLILQSKIKTRENLPIQLVFYTNPQLLVSILIIPFIASMISESVSWIKNKSEKNASVYSIGWIIVGLLVMGSFFIINIITYIVSN